MAKPLHSYISQLLDMGVTGEGQDHGNASSILKEPENWRAANNASSAGKTDVHTQ